MAFYHAKLIKQNRPINHFLWSAIYSILVIITIIFNFKVAIAAVLIREVFFSPVLNFLRGKAFFYTNPSPQGSVLDRLETGNSLQIIYFISFAALIVIQFFL